MKNILKVAVLATFLGAILAGGHLAYAQLAPVCSPATQVVNLNDFVSFSASGGDGTYYWLAANGNPNMGSGSTFGTRFFVAGDRIVVLTSNGQNTLCLVRVAGGQVLGVSDVSTGPEDVAVWAVVIGLISALFIYKTLVPKLRK